MCAAIPMVQCLSRFCGFQPVFWKHPIHVVREFHLGISEITLGSQCIRLPSPTGMFILMGNDDATPDARSLAARCVLWPPRRKTNRLMRRSCFLERSHCLTYGTHFVHACLNVYAPASNSEYVLAVCFICLRLIPLKVCQAIRSCRGLGSIFIPGASELEKLVAPAEAWATEACDILKIKVRSVPTLVAVKCDAAAPSWFNSGMGDFVLNGM